jgi:hypothetical protein
MGTRFSQGEMGGPNLFQSKAFHAACFGPNGDKAHLHDSSSLIDAYYWIQ